MASVDLKAIGKELSNWGRWGPDDELGTLNLITPEKIVEASRLPRSGRVISLAIPFNAKGVQTGQSWRSNPIHLMAFDGGDAHVQKGREGVRFADDYVIMPLQCATQWDALSHAWYDHTLYNGYSAQEISSMGARKLSIERVKNGITSRGVLIDVAHHRGVKWLDPSHGITPAELDEVARAQGVEVTSGDIVLVRTGWRRKFVEERNPFTWNGHQPGINWECARWLHDHEVAAVCSDNSAVEHSPGELAEDYDLPMHMILLRDLGMMLGEIFDLEALSEACAADGVYEFLFVAPPLPVTGAVGSPINPLAIK
jgi:kynurenine formamidase